MPRFGKLMLASGLALVAGAPAALAQVAGIPVYYNPRGGTGVSVAGNLGFLSSDGGDGKGYAVTGGIGAGPAYITASVGQFNPASVGSVNPDAEMTYGGTVSFKLFGGGVLPLSISPQIGVGMVKFGGVTYTSVPIGVGVGLNLPLFPLKPWIAPRVRLARSSGGGLPSDSETFIGVSAGADFNLLLGLGFHAAFDYEPKKTVNNVDIPSTTVFGIGAHFNFRVPMM